MSMHPYHLRVLCLSSRDEAQKELARLGVRSPADQWMADKLTALPLRAEDLDGRAAALLKQELLALGGDCAVHQQVAAFDRTPRPVILLGTGRIYRRLIPRLEQQPFGLAALGQGLAQLLARHEQLPPPIHTAHGVLSFERTLVMGILNMTEGSFSGDGLGEDVAAAVAQGQAFAQAGADLLDVGGESTRPGAPEVEEEEELRRVIPPLRALRTEVSLPFSVDTRRARVAREAVAAGADLINDIWALRQPEMLETAAELGVPVCLMHMQGTPQTMQHDPRYEDVMSEIYSFLAARLEAAVEAGVPEEHLLVDPGLGFGKLPEHNLEILRRLREFRSLGRPVLIGPSRKATIGKILDKPVEERQWGTAAMVALGVANGANIIRVHDVEEMVQVVRVADAIMRGQW
jgi:dihydropteroate synthase